jgi:hypothetical protein
MTCENLVPLTKWLEEPEKKGQCKSCSLGALIPEYLDVLAEFEVPGLKEEIDKALNDESDPIGKVAQVLDEVKQKVSDEVRARLQVLDCGAINHDGGYEGSDGDGEG